MSLEQRNGRNGRNGRVAVKNGRNGRTTGSRRGDKVVLPEDFLRLPATCVRIGNQRGDDEGVWVDTRQLEREMLLAMSAESGALSAQCVTRVVKRDSRVGLGMSLREHAGSVYIQALLCEDGSRMVLDTADGADGAAGRGEPVDAMTTTMAHRGGPAYRAGLRPGDRLLGINGRPFVRGRLSGGPLHDQVNNQVNNQVHNQINNQVNNQVSCSSDEVLKGAADAISQAASPLVLHVHRDHQRTGSLVLLPPQDAASRSTLYDAVESPPRTSLATSPTTSIATSLASPVGNNLGSNPGGLSHTHRKPRGPFLHPFAKALSSRDLLPTPQQELVITQQLRIFTDRTRQWESKLSFRLRSDFSLRPMIDPRDIEPSYHASCCQEGDVPPFFDYKFARNVRSYAPSTPMIHDWRRGGSLTPRSLTPPTTRQSSREAAVYDDLYAGLDQNDAEVQGLILGNTPHNNLRSPPPAAIPQPFYPAPSDPTDIFVPLMGVRKALCIRILNSFLDNHNRTAFTIWCYDIESRMEWYAPVRYYTDFKELRNTLLRLDKSIGNIPFSLGWTNFWAESDAATKESRRGHLETFLRRAFAGVYRGRLHPYLAEVAVHLQTFVGCDTVLMEDDTALALNSQVAINESSYRRTALTLRGSNYGNIDRCDGMDELASMQLKRSVQRYVYRLLLLPLMEQLLSQFIDATKTKFADTVASLKSSTRKQPNLLAIDKDESTADVEKVRDFIDQVQQLILEGCRLDLESISHRREFAAIKDDLNDSKRDCLIREAVREQVEIEVYVPLRSTISKYLVYAWFNEDVEMRHKIKALANKPQSYFKIQPEHQSSSDWRSVSKILEEGVGRSTLPCVKLRAIVDAAKEIAQLDAEEHALPSNNGKNNNDSNLNNAVGGSALRTRKSLGADDFLPIFIFCFVQAKIERPSALCALLQTMCDPTKLSGETGYYLASFQAAMTHIHELDLSEVNDEISIFHDSY